jgi:uncharacterized protein (TIGR02444 family)
VKDALLDLQDNHGQSVCFLLWAAWAATNGRDVAPHILTEAVEWARCWETEVVGPLRTARRGLKAVPGLDAASRAILGGCVQTDELAAEQHLLDALESLAPAESRIPTDLETLLRSASAAWGSPAPPGRLTALAAALAST